MRRIFGAKRDQAPAPTLSDVSNNVCPRNSNSFLPIMLGFSRLDVDGLSVVKPEGSVIIQPYLLVSSVRFLITQVQTSNFVARKRSY